jgi:hypothetical protein
MPKKNSEFGRQFSTRFRRRLEDAVAAWCERNGRSVNELVNLAVEAYVTKAQVSTLEPVRVEKDVPRGPLSDPCPDVSLTSSSIRLTEEAAREASRELCGKLREVHESTKHCTKPGTGRGD